MRGANHPLYGVHKYGKNAYSWIDGRTPLHHLIRNIEEYKKWHTICLKRDNYTCQECGQYGGNLEVHHEIAFAAILNDFLIEYDQFSPMEDKETLARLASKYKPFWNIDNGKTLCKDCHRLTFTGRPKIERRFT